MIPKLYRLKKNWQFQKIIKEKKKLINESFLIFWYLNKLGHCQFGISVPQKMIKKSTKRNYYRRQVHSMLNSIFKKNNNFCCYRKNHFDLIIIIRQPYLTNIFLSNQEKLTEVLSSLTNS